MTEDKTPITIPHVPKPPLGPIIMLPTEEQPWPWKTTAIVLAIAFLISITINIWQSGKRNDLATEFQTHLEECQNANATE